MNMYNSQTSTNGHLSTKATLFCLGEQSIHLLDLQWNLFKMATATEACP